MHQQNILFDLDGTLTDQERAFFAYSAANYVKLKDLHLAEGYDQ